MPILDIFSKYNFKNNGVLNCFPLHLDLGVHVSYTVKGVPQDGQDVQCAKIRKDKLFFVIHYILSDILSRNLVKKLLFK